jgi:hypothetical protein
MVAIEVAPTGSCHYKQVLKVVGIGSVGTLCMVALMMSIVDHPFFLQVKDANASVPETYAGKIAYTHHGERVIQGRRSRSTDPRSAVNGFTRYHRRYLADLALY